MSRIQQLANSLGVSALVFALSVCVVSAQQDDNPFGKSKSSRLDDPFAPAKPSVAKVATLPSSKKDSRRFASPIEQNNSNTESQLNQVLKCDYYETRFADVVEEMKMQLGFEIHLHESSRENNLDEDSLITMSYRGGGAQFRN